MYFKLHFWVSIGAPKLSTRELLFYHITKLDESYISLLIMLYNTGESGGGNFQFFKKKYFWWIFGTERSHFMKKEFVENRYTKCNWDVYWFTSRDALKNTSEPAASNIGLLFKIAVYRSLRKTLGVDKVNKKSKWRRTLFTIMQVARCCWI